VAGRLPRASLSVPDAAEASGVSGVGEVSNAGTVANALTTKVTSRIDPPGHEAAHEALYSLDGSRQLTGAMDANGHNIENIGVLELADDVVLGAECDQKYIGTTDTGMLVSCVNASENTEKKGKWRIPNANELPVGSIYIAVTEESPEVSLGYGTWEPFGEGKVLVASKSADAPDECASGGDVLATSVSADCLFYELQATHDGSTGAAALSLRQMPDHRHFNWITLSEETKCEPECLILSDNPSTNSTSAKVAAKEAFDARAASSNREGNVRINSWRPLSPLEQLQAELAEIEAEYEIVLARLKRPMQRVGEKTNSQETHQHGVHPAITVAMWKRTL
jgi:hypothetical protein